MKKMLVGVVIVLAAICFFFLVQKWVGDDLDGLGDGPWTMVSVEFNGKKAPTAGLKDITAKFTKSSVIWTVPDDDGPKELDGDLKINPSKNPKEIDLDHPFARGGANTGIYEIKGDTLLICVGDRRPSEFSSKGQLVIMLKRR